MPPEGMLPGGPYCSSARMLGRMDEEAAVDTPTGSPIPSMETGIHKLLGVEAVELTPERVVLRLAVDSRVHQPMGLLHGGVSALLAESAASMGAAISVGPEQRVAGVELNASHLRIMRRGVLTATATPIRKGRSLQVWEVDLTDQDGRGICRSRCTVAVVGPPPAGSGGL